MPELDLIKVFIHRLNAASISYFVTGDVACVVYGEPRLTHDIDLVLELSQPDASRIVEAFPMDGFKADVYTMGQDELHQWAMQKRRKYDYEGEPIWFAPIEYVILRKLQYFREGGSDKHLRDIAGMLLISPGLIDSETLEERIRQYGLMEDWEKAKERSQAAL
jgi:hypothetical protein